MAKAPERKSVGKGARPCRPAKRPDSRINGSPSLCTGIISAIPACPGASCALARPRTYRPYLLSIPPQAIPTCKHLDPNPDLVMTRNCFPHAHCASQELLTPVDLGSCLRCIAYTDPYSIQLIYSLLVGGTQHTSRWNCLPFTWSVVSR